MYYIIDLETVADDKLPVPLLEKLVEVRPDGRIKDPDKQIASVLEKQQEIIDKFALTPMTAKICSVNVGVSEGRGQKGMVEPTWHTICGVDEKALLVELYQTVPLQHINSLDHVITFNGKPFDIPILTIRSLIHGLAPISLNESKYDQETHFDVRTFLSNYDNYARGTLEDWAIRFGLINEYSKVHGSDIQNLYDEEDFEAIKAHNLLDAQLTWKLYLKVADVKYGVPL